MEKRERIIRNIIQIIQSIWEYLLISIVIVFVLIAVYALWDIKFIANKALPTEYEIYKPKENKLSFEELQKINPEVIGWLDIYGTNIDYPVVQGDDNDKYLMTDAAGKYSLAGAVFLDYKNRSDFSDFNNIIYGHSMAHNAMFGDVSDFLEKEFFDSHQYGDLYFNNTHHGLRIIAIEEVDAYSSNLHRIVVGDEKDKKAFLEEIVKSSVHDVSEKELNTNSTYVLLYTCTSSITNGRHLLVCVLTDETYENIYKDEKITSKDTVDSPRLRITLFIIILLIIILLLIIAKAMRHYEEKQKKSILEEKR